MLLRSGKGVNQQPEPSKLPARPRRYNKTIPALSSQTKSQDALRWKRHKERAGQTARKCNVNDHQTTKDAVTEESKLPEPMSCAYRSLGVMTEAHDTAECKTEIYRDAEGQKMYEPMLAGTSYSPVVTRWGLKGVVVGAVVGVCVETNVVSWLAKNL